MNNFRQIMQKHKPEIEHIIMTTIITVSEKMDIVEPFCSYPPEYFKKKRLNAKINSKVQMYDSRYGGMYI